MIYNDEAKQLFKVPFGRCNVRSLHIFTHKCSTCENLHLQRMLKFMANATIHGFCDVVRDFRLDLIIMRADILITDMMESSVNTQENSNLYMYVLITRF